MHTFFIRKLLLMAAVGLAACGGATTATPAAAPAPEAAPLLIADPSMSTTDPKAIWLPSAVTVPPRAIARPRLVVPDSITRRGIRGAVSLEYVVDTLGRVEPNIRVIATDHPLLVDPAKRMVAGMRYRPGRVQGRAVRVQLGTRVRIGITGS
jgi:outer membrane biosynthesis protein TonB